MNWLATIALGSKDSAHNDRISGHNEIACNKRIAELEIFCLRRSKGHKALSYFWVRLDGVGESWHL